MALLRILQWMISISLLCIIISFVLISGRTFGHRLRVSNAKFRLVPLSISLYGLSYSYTDTISISSSHVQVNIQLQKLSNMTFFVATIHDYDYIDVQHRVSASKVHVEVHLLPVAPEAFFDVILHDFRARIIHSQNTPSWLQTTRQNVIRTILNGEHLRLDDFKTQVILCSATTGETVTTVPDLHDNQAHSEKYYPSELSTVASRKSDESVATLNASEWYIKGAQQRLYHFGSIDAQLRRSWDPSCDKGTFVLIAQDSSWVFDHHSSILATTDPVQHWHDPRIAKPSRSFSFLNKLLLVLKTFLSFPFILIKAIYDPGSALTLHSPRLDITFDQFRLRDADLVRQLWEYTRRKYELLKEKEGMDFTGFVQDMLVATILGDSRKRKD